MCRVSALLVKYFFAQKYSMSSSSNTGSKRGSSTKTKKNTITQKKPATTKKTKTVATKKVKEKPAKPTIQNSVVEKTLANIEQLGNQTFARSPFSQYYNEWLNNLQKTVTEFETTSNVKINKTFTKKREQAFLDMQTITSEQRTKESALSKAKKDLQKTNQDLKEIGETNAKKKHELHNKHNTNTQKLIPQIKALENDIASQEKIKFGFFQFSAKKAATIKLEQTKQELKEAKDQLEPITQNFEAEQKELQDNYTAKKQELTTKSDTLNKEVEQLEVDTSIKTRKEICTRLNNAISELVERQTAKTDK
jgi:cbb3-type cytochrome oxidase cytochrome c subunit